jgi:hypothetical protein
MTSTNLPYSFLARSAELGVLQAKVDLANAQLARFQLRHNRLESDIAVLKRLIEQDFSQDEIEELDLYRSIYYYPDSSYARTLIQGSYKGVSFKIEKTEAYPTLYFEVDGLQIKKRSQRGPSSEQDFSYYLSEKELFSFTLLEKAEELENAV